ncbi:Hypothetical predicted protein [Octopus vulgaris]|uniref:Uncharacterized protein n=1 Tax=Octopus vulgaris TaxID=6645 RepID=A0AA36FJD3_OCTVU|nr:Hypothetical predicted protein [Octopus vulgaris]
MTCPQFQAQRTNGSERQKTELVGEAVLLQPYVPHDSKNWLLKQDAFSGTKSETAFLLPSSVLCGGLSIGVDVRSPCDHWFNYDSYYSQK